MARVMRVLNDPGSVLPRIVTEDEEGLQYERLQDWQYRALEASGLIALHLPSTVEQAFDTTDPEQRWRPEVCAADAEWLIAMRLTGGLADAEALRDFVASLLRDLRRYDGWERRERDTHERERIRLRKEVDELNYDVGYLQGIVRKAKGVLSRTTGSRHKAPPLPPEEAVVELRRILRPVRTTPGKTP